MLKTFSPQHKEGSIRTRVEQIKKTKENKKFVFSVWFVTITFDFGKVVKFFFKK